MADLKKLDSSIYEEVFNRSNLDLADQLYAPTFVGHHPPHRALVGPEGIKEQVRRTHAAYQDLHYVVEDQLVSGDQTLTRWTMTGKSRKKLEGAGSSDGPVRLGGLTLLRFADGRVEEEWTYWDQLGEDELPGNRPDDS